MWSTDSNWNAIVNLLIFGYNSDIETTFTIITTHVSYIICYDVFAFLKFFTVFGFTNFLNIETWEFNDSCMS